MKEAVSMFKKQAKEGKKLYLFILASPSFVSSFRCGNSFLFYLGNMIKKEFDSDHRIRAKSLEYLCKTL